MRTFSGARGALGLAAVAAIGLFAATTPADAYLGNWNSNSHCPIDDPAMLASPAGDYTACLALGGAGPVKIGNLNLRTRITDEFGAYGPSVDAVSLVPSSAAQSWSTSVDPGGLGAPSSLSLACGPIPPSRDPQSLYRVCWSLSDVVASVKPITATIEPAGPSSDFRMSGVTGSGPVISLPIKVRLQNDLLGTTCHIGSDAQPIMLHLMAGGPPGLHYRSADPNGYPVTSDIYALGGDLTHYSFAAPAATGCGSGGSLDPVVNAALGLPSAGGSNSLSIDRDVSLESTSAGGAVLSQAFHTALSR